MHATGSANAFATEPVMKALTIGGAMIDTIAVIANERVERMAMRNADTAYLLLEEGRKIEADDVSTHCGGGAVNAAVALARLGHDVSALIKLGQDQRAETLLARLSQEGVSTRFAVRDGRAPTGASVLVAAHDRNAAIFTFRGANTLLEAADLKSDAFAADLVYVAGLSNQSADCFPGIVARAKAEGALVAANPGIRQLSARQEQFRDVVGSIDILAINRVEAGALVPGIVGRSREGGPPLKPDRATPSPAPVMPDLARRGFSVGGLELSLAAFFSAVHALGPRWIVVTDGREGAYVSAPSGVVHCPAAPVQATGGGTAGAGDAFNATFAAYITQSASAADAVVAASANAASVIGHLDTQTGLLRHAALETRVAALMPPLKVSHWTL
jgi:ribokinase